LRLVSIAVELRRALRMFGSGGALENGAMRDFARSMIVFTVLSVAACGEGARSMSGELSSDGSIRRGTWIYDVTAQIDTQAGRDQLMQLMRCYRLTEVYLAIGPHQELLADANLPDFLTRLIGNGVRADALLSPDATDTTAEVDALVDAVIAYNEGRTINSERFVGVHIDIEPWIGTGSSGAWIQPLIGLYRHEASRVAGAGLPLIADVNGAKMADDSISNAQQRDDMFAAVRRLVLMQYDVPLSSVESHTTSFLDDATIQGAHDVIVAIRSANAAWTPQIATDFDPVPGYGGWALYDSSGLSLSGCSP
jgi:hypothetical protein